MPPPRSIDNLASHLITKPVDDFVQQETPQCYEIPEQKRVLKECAHAFSTSFKVIFSNHHYSAYFIVSCQLVPVRTDQEIENLANSFPLLENNTLIKSQDDEILVTFWKNMFNTPFGPKFSQRIVTEVVQAIHTLELVYTPPAPPATDKRHCNAKPQPGICGLWHFT